MGEFDDKFKGELKDLKEYIAIATVDAKHYQETNLRIIEHMTQKENIPGVYVTLNKPFNTLMQMFERKHIDPRLIIFIDAVTQLSGESKKQDNCLFIGSPENLSDISVAMDQAVRAIPGKEKFLFFDSLSTLLIYNKAATVARFIHFLSSKMRVWQVKGVIISLRKESDKELISELSQTVDVLIELGDKA